MFPLPHTSTSTYSVRSLISTNSGEAEVLIVESGWIKDLLPQLKINIISVLEIHFLLSGPKLIFFTRSVRYLAQLVIQMHRKLPTPFLAFSLSHHCPPSTPTHTRTHAHMCAHTSLEMGMLESLLEFPSGCIIVWKLLVLLQEQIWTEERVPVLAQHIKQHKP